MPPSIRPAPARPSYSIAIVRSCVLSVNAPIPIIRAGRKPGPEKLEFGARPHHHLNGSAGKSRSCAMTSASQTICDSSSEAHSGLFIAA